VDWNLKLVQENNALIGNFKDLSNPK